MTERIAKEDQSADLADADFSDDDLDPEDVFLDSDDDDLDSDAGFDSPAAFADESLDFAVFRGGSIFHRTTCTEHVAWLTTLSAVVPRNVPQSFECPVWPITKRSMPASFT
jgi:hypothetical protein